MSNGAEDTHAVAGYSTSFTQSCINLCDYMYSAWDTSYSQFGGGQMESLTGYQPLQINGKDVVSSVNQDGFYAQAFVSTSPSNTITGRSQVIIAYEGTQAPFTQYSPSGVTAQAKQFTGGQLRDDADIAAGTEAPSYKDAANFAAQVLNKVKTHFGIHRNNVFLTGHSLGAADAEYAAKATGLSGVTFAAPGIEGNATVSPLVDYLDAGDPIANYANNDVNPEDNTWGQNVTLSTDINHYGTVSPLMNQNNAAAAAALQQAGNYFSGSGELAAFQLARGLIPNLLDQGSSLTINSPSIPFPGHTYTFQGNGDFHSLSTYAADLNVTLVCFGQGTLITTVRGPVPVQDLKIGDTLVTTTGCHRSIKWLGHRTVDCHRHPRPHEAQPIRVAAHAFGESRPARDLLLSPGHAICVDVAGEILVPVGALVNGATVTQVAVASVTYWHVELENHDVILAEGLPCESYLDMGNRSFFLEAETTALCGQPDTPRLTHADFCRPYLVEGPQIEALRARLSDWAAQLEQERHRATAAA